MIKRTLLAIMFMAGCVTTMNDDIFPKEKANPKYKVGDCVNVFDYETGQGKPDDIVKVETVTETMYYYRWWLPQKEWALELNSGIGKFETFEKMTYLTECPK